MLGGDSESEIQILRPFDIVSQNLAKLGAISLSEFLSPSFVFPSLRCHSPDIIHNPAFRVEETTNVGIPSDVDIDQDSLSQDVHMAGELEDRATENDEIQIETACNNRKNLKAWTYWTTYSAQEERKKLLGTHIQPFFLFP